MNINEDGFIEVEPVEETTQPLPQDPAEQPTTTKRPWLKVISAASIGIIIGIVALGIAINFGLIDEYQPVDNYKETMLQYYTLGYESGAFETINYTQSTGMIPYFYNNTIQEISIVDQCNLLIQQGGQQ